MDSVVMEKITAEIDAQPLKLAPKPLRAPLQYGSAGYDVEQSFVIKDLIPEDSFTSIYGPSGSYKSFIALDWACHIATGKDWDCHKVNQGAVLYVAGEGDFGVKLRIRAWEIQHNVTSIDNLARLPMAVFPADDDQINIVVEYCREIKSKTGHAVKLIILDTLARCYGGNDENSSRDMGAFIKGCDTIKQLTGATVLVVHHSGKNVENGGRGSSSLPAALDVEFRVKREDNEQALVLTCSKMKDAEPPETKAYDLINVHIRTDSDGDEITSLCVIPEGRQPVDDQIVPTKTPRWNRYHTALWQVARSRTQAGDLITKALVRDDLKAQGFNTKHFARWLNKLVDEGALMLDGEVIFMGSNCSEINRN